MASLHAARLRVGCSLVALLAAPAAWAGCAANPAQANTATACTDSETGGLVVGASGATVSAAAEASVTAPAG